MMAPETVDTGVCPYCGLAVQYQKVSDQAVGDGYVLTFHCPASKCRQPVALIMPGSGHQRWYPLPQVKEIPGVPTAVMQAFREAVLSLEAGAPRAAACMLRRTVASACTDKDIADEEKGRWLALNERIERIRVELIPATYRAALATKILGDAGAHEEAEDRLGPLDESTVRVAVTVVRQILANLYELPEQVKGLGAS